MLAGLAFRPFRYRDADLANLRHVVGHPIPNRSPEGLLAAFDEIPLAVGKQMAVLRHRPIQLERQIVDGVVLKVMRIPHIVAASVKVLSVNGNDLGMVPAHSTAPRADPEVNFGRSIGRQALGELGNDVVAVHGHTDNVTKHHSNHHGFLPFPGRFGNLLKRRLEAVHEFTIGRTETENVGPYLSSAENFTHDFGKPVVVSVGMDRFPWPCHLGSLMKLPDDTAGRYVPKLMMMLGMLLPENIVRGGTDVR
mmetsp:Transcript_26041/g.57884  ORF Transcript_26041/g.57884 Transcript_26041/m.57884 type:complete len:251 (-) Transcript_26041:358-1110(-)